MKQRFSSMGAGHGRDSGDVRLPREDVPVDQRRGLRRRLGVRLDSQGVLQVSNRVCLAPGGTFDQVLAQVGPAQADLLAACPAARSAFAAGGACQVPSTTGGGHFTRHDEANAEAYG